MALNGIDISDYQRGIDLTKVPFDFMICKATEGTSIVHSTCDPYIQTCKRLGKLWGFYHFMNGEDPVAQADYFFKHCENYFGEGIPVLDYEMYGRIGTAGAKRFLDRIYELTGVRCIVYMSRSVCNEEDWSQIAPNHALWVAQYANNNPTGYQVDPWLPGGGFGAWSSCAIHQYTSTGRLDGYGGNLDLDIAYMTREAWAKFANPKGAAAPGGGNSASDGGGSDPAPDAGSGGVAPSGSTLDLAYHVVSNNINGDARRDYCGSRYDEVQGFINDTHNASAETLAEWIKAGKYGNNPVRKTVIEACDGKYQEAMDIINGAGKTYTVKSGDTLSGIGAKLGVNWKDIASKNGISSPYTIYPGQKLKY